VHILGSKFWALEENRGAHGELMAKKWLDSIEKQKKQFEGA